MENIISKRPLAIPSTIYYKIYQRAENLVTEVNKIEAMVRENKNLVLYVCLNYFSVLTSDLIEL